MDAPDRGDAGSSRGGFDGATWSWMQRVEAVRAHGPFVRYGVAVVLIVIASLVARELDRNGVPTLLAPFFAAVALAAWFGGFGPGLFSTGLSLLAVDLLFNNPADGLLSSRWEELSRLTTLLIVSLLISGLSASQQRVTQALRTSERRFRVMVETANEGIVLLDRGRRIVYANDQIASLLGFPSASELTGRSLTEFVFPADADETIRQITANLASGQPNTVEWNMRRVDGSELVAVIGMSPAPGANGQITGVLVTVTDISGRKAMEEQLAVANERYALATDAAHEMIYDWDMRSDHVYRGPALFTILGYHPDEVEPTSGWWQDRWHPDDRRRLTLPSVCGVDESGNYRLEYQVRNRAGRYRTVLDIGTIVRDASGEPVRAAGSMVDITERKEAEKALELLARLNEPLAAGADAGESLERLARVAVPALADWVVIDLVDADGRIRRAAWSPDSLANLTWQPDAAVIESPTPVLAPDLKHAAGGMLEPEAIAALTAFGARSLLAIPLETLGGRVGLLTLLAGPDRDPYQERDIALAAELARRGAFAIGQARLYRDLQLAEARYRGFFEASKDGILVMDLAGRIIDVNPALLEMIGQHRDELLDTSALALPVEGADWAREAIRSLREAGEWRGEFSLNTNRGEPLAVDARANLVRLPDGVVFVAVLRDVSERRALEEAQEAFIGFVAHDLKNPLSAVRGQAQLLQRRVQKGEQLDPERLRQGLAGISAGATRMSALIDDLADIARLRGGHLLELRRQPLDLVELTRGIVEDTGRVHERHALRFEPPQSGITGLWDSARLERVLANLIGNAIKYSPHGGEVSIAVKRATRGGRDWATLSVSDRGVGIPAADLPYIFERFHRGGNVARFAGSGIGLSGVRSIVEQHGGTIDVESTEGQGSVFTLHLPVEAADLSETA